MVWISVLWFEKYETVFVFYDAVFPTYPENRDTKYKFFFLNQETKKNWFLLLPLKQFHYTYIIFYENSYVFAACELS